MTLELKRLLFPPYSFILYKKVYQKKIGLVSFLSTHRYLKNILFSALGLSALMLRKTFKSLFSLVVKFMLMIHNLFPCHSISQSDCE